MNVLQLTNDFPTEGWDVFGYVLVFGFGSGILLMVFGLGMIAWGVSLMLKKDEDDLSGRWRHKVRGTTYQLESTGTAQVAGEPLCDGDDVVIYSSEDDGRWHVRRKSEFHDGRFEEIKGTHNANS